MADYGGPRQLPIDSPATKLKNNVRCMSVFKRIVLLFLPYRAFFFVLDTRSYESPPGIKANLLRTYEAWDEQYIGKGSVTRAQMLFVLAWFHALAQERRTYIPQGFTKFYEFSFADLRSGADIIDAMFVKLNKQNAQQVETGNDRCF